MNDHRNEATSQPAEASSPNCAATGWNLGRTAEGSTESHEDASLQGEILSPETRQRWVLERADDTRGNPVWNPFVSAVDYQDAASEKYQQAVLEQYKLEVEMADRVSARRNVVNTFFLTLNSAIFTAIGLFWKDRPSGSVFWLLPFLFIVVAQCMVWQQLVRGYVKIKDAKYDVIKHLERRLPAAFYRAQEARLNDYYFYRRPPLEQSIPYLFCAVYILAFLAVVFQALFQ